MSGSSQEVIRVLRSQAKSCSCQTVIRQLSNRQLSDGHLAIIRQLWSSSQKKIILFFESSAISKSMPNDAYDISVGNNIYLTLLRLLTSCNSFASKSHKTLPNQPLYWSCRQKLSSLLGNKVNHIFSVLAIINERKIDKKNHCNTLQLHF